MALPSRWAARHNHGVGGAVPSRGRRRLVDDLRAGRRDSSRRRPVSPRRCTTAVHLHRNRCSGIYSGTLRLCTSTRWCSTACSRGPRPRQPRCFMRGRRRRTTRSPRCSRRSTPACCAYGVVAGPARAGRPPRAIPLPSRGRSWRTSPRRRSRAWWPAAARRPSRASAPLGGPLCAKRHQSVESRFVGRHKGPYRTRDGWRVCDQAHRTTRPGIIQPHATVS